MRYYEVEFYGFGGEFTCGVVSDEDEKEFLEDRCDFGDLDFYNDGDEIEVPCYDKDDIAHVYGIGVDSNDSYSIKVRELKSEPEDSYNLDYIDEDSAVYEKSLDDDIYLDTFSYSTPYISKEEISKEYGEDSLVLIGANFEKRMYGSYLVACEGEFDIDNLILVAVTLDETVGVDNVLIGVIYKTKDEIKEYLLDFVKKDSLSSVKDELVEKINNYYSDDEVQVIELLDELNYDINEALDVSRYKQGRNNFIGLESDSLADFEGVSNYNEAKLFNLDGEEL